MSRRRGRFTQADVIRAIRAAQRTGAGDVIIEPDGTIRITANSKHVETEEEMLDRELAEFEAELDAKEAKHR